MKWRLSLVGLATAALVAACGGGDEPMVYAAGDSLNDVGVFGVRFTVQSADASNPYKIWVDHIAASAGISSMCAAYDGNAAFAVQSGCTGYAVGGAQINPVTLLRTGGLVSGATIGSDTTPMSVVQQIKDMASGRTFGPQDLILIDGGGNDANAIATSLLEGLAGNPQAIAAYSDILKDLLPATTVDAAVAAAIATPSSPTALIELGGAYMQATAAMLTSAIQTELLAKGAQRVVVLNLPDLSKTPALNTQPDSAKAIVSAWAQAMNTKLQSDLGAEPKVLIVNFFGTLNGWVADKGSARIGLVSLSNVTERACGNTSAASCSEAALDTSGPGDWRTHLFADNLHATPFANQLTANHVQAQIKAKGWN